MVRGKGSVLRASLAEDVTPEYVRNVWSKVTDMSNATHVDTITEATGGLMDILNALESGADQSNNANGKSYSDTFKFDGKDLILYALGGKITNSILFIIYCFANISTGNTGSVLFGRIRIHSAFLRLILVS